MISMSSNGGQVSRNIAARARIASSGIDAACKSTGVFIRAEAARNTPVRTGNLRQGWEGPNMVGKWHYEVKDEVEYAMYVEKGTWRFAGRHMLGRAAHKAEPIHKAAIAAAIKAALR